MPNTRLLLAAAAAIAATSLLTGCPPTPPPSSTRPAPSANATLDTPILGNEPAASGIYLPLPTRQPLTGDARTRALTDRKTLTATLAQKFAPPTTSPSTQPATQPAEPSPLAVKYYLNGRGKFLDGANSEAMDYLERALQLDPNAFTVLRLMGRVSFASAQLARGAQYLERAWKIDPDDIEVNYLLGRYWLERKQNDRAAFYLLRADDSPRRNASSALAPLVSFYLARALSADGYHLAAAEASEKFLATIAIPVPAYHYDRELAYYIDEQWAAHLTAAENYALLSNFPKALPHYLAAAEAQPKDPFINSRLVNAQLQTQHPDDAREAALSFVAAANGSADSVKLLAFTYQRTGNQKRLLDDIRAHLNTSSPDDPAPALTLASAEEFLGQKAAALQTLATFQTAHPDNQDILNRLFRYVDSPDSFRIALEATARALHAAPENHDEILRPLLAIADDAPAKTYLAAQTGSARPPQSPSAEQNYLTALLLTSQKQHDAFTAALFQTAIAQNPRFFPARNAYNRFLINREDFKQANTLAQQTLDADAQNPKAWLLAIENQTIQHLLSNALKLALQARQKFPDNAEIRLDLADIYRRRYEFTKATGELESLLQEAPRFEPAYKDLINLLLSRTRSPEVNSRELISRAMAVLGRLVANVPDSTFGQMTTATIYVRGGRGEEAQAIAQRLVDQHPDDPELIISLAQIEQLLDKTDAAVTTLREALNHNPNPAVARALARIYRDQGKPGEALALTRKLFEQNAARDAFIVLHADELAEQKKVDEAIALLSSNIKTLPNSALLATSLANMQADNGKAPDAVNTILAFLQRNGETRESLYLLTHFYSLAGDENASVATLEKILAASPDDPRVNNDLGYFWANNGLHLEQSESMVKKALDNEPENPAYLDSLGWVYYKKGDFAKASEWLEKAAASASQPDVIQHLADALYRGGKQTIAVERWRQALSMLRTSETPLSPDEEKVKTYLEAAIAAVEKNQPPAVTPIAPQPPRSAGPATTPAAAPN